MQFWTPYRLRIRRKRLLVRARRKARALKSVEDRTGLIAPGDLLVFSTLRNEVGRLPGFLAYYRALGVTHFLIVDNGSTDGSDRLLAGEPDVSLWRTGSSYKAARFGMDWMNHLLRRYGHGHWCLTVDPDELLVHPYADSRPLRALTDWLAASGRVSFPAMLLDLYPKGPIGAARDRGDALDDPLEHLRWFDAGNYRISRNWRHDNLWIQGGPRERMFFADRPEKAPALNKLPLVLWDRSFAYDSATHTLLPRGLNRAYDTLGGEAPSGMLLHTKFLPEFPDKAEEELHRRQHYGKSREYIAYAEGLESSPTLWTETSTQLEPGKGAWRQLEALGLMARGHWS